MTGFTVPFNHSAEPQDAHELSDSTGSSGFGSTRLWALASGSGGVGRSTLAAVIGAQLVHRGQRVCLVDADWSSPLLAAMLDVGAQCPGSLWTSGPVQSVRSCEHQDLHVASGGSPLAASPSRQQCQDLLPRLRALPQDEAVVDLPSGNHDAALDLWLSADHPLLVAVPERLPLEATARLLARVFSRIIGPWLTRKLGHHRAQEVLAEGWDQCAGRTGTWMRTVARLAGVAAEELAEQAGTRPIHLILNRVRRADDIDVGHALVTAAGHGLGLDLRFRAVIPFEDEGWIRARRLSIRLPGIATSVLSMEIDDLLDRIDTDSEVPTPSRGPWGAGEQAEAIEAIGG